MYGFHLACPPYRITLSCRTHHCTGDGCCNYVLVPSCMQWICRCDKYVAVFACRVSTSKDHDRLWNIVQLQLTHMTCVVMGLLTLKLTVAHRGATCRVRPAASVDESCLVLVPLVLPNCFLKMFASGTYPSAATDSHSFSTYPSRVPRFRRGVQALGRYACAARRAALPTSGC